MLFTSTNILEGYVIEEYLGLVSGETILGANLFKDFSAGLRDWVGGRVNAYEQQLDEAKAIALRELEGRAAKLGANGVIGMDLDYESLRGSMLMVSITGTAVRVRPV